LKFLGNAVWEEGWEKPTDADLLELAIIAKNEQPPTGELRPFRTRIDIQRKKT
jgi:hypothetical protein